MNIEKKSFIRENKIKEPILFIVMEPCAKVDYDISFKSLKKIYDENANFRFYTKSETKYLIITAVEEDILKLIVERLMQEFDVQLKASNTQIIYKQTIKGTVKAEGRFVRQNTCPGHFGVCSIEIEPKDYGTGYEFVNKITDDSVIPGEYIEPLKLGIQESMELGVTCGYPVADIKVNLYDGAYHEIDSRGMSFKIAGSIAFRSAIKDNDPVFLEPILKLEFNTDDIKEDTIKLVEDRGGKIKNNLSENKTTIFIALRLTISDEPLALRNLVKESLSVDISHYEEVSNTTHKEIMEEMNFYKCEHVDLLKYRTNEEEISDEILKILKDLETNTLEKDPSRYRNLQENLGSAYGQLGGIRNSEENLLKSIDAYNKSFKVSEDLYRWNLVSLQNTIGRIFLSLAKINNTKNNVLNAINAFNVAVKIAEEEGKQNTSYIHIGDAYKCLANMQDLEDNLLKALDSYAQYLKIADNKKDFTNYKPNALEYVTVKNSIGNIYLELAEIKDKEKNIIKAIEIFNESLSVKNLEKDDFEYAITQNYIGIGYIKLSKILLQKDEKTEENILRAIEAFNLALSIKTIKKEYFYDYIFPFEEEYPLKYAEILNNLGTAFSSLAEIKNKEENLAKANKAIDKALCCYNEALRVKTEMDYPVEYQMIQKQITNILMDRNEI